MGRGIAALQSASRKETEMSKKRVFTTLAITAWVLSVLLLAGMFAAWFAAIWQDSSQWGASAFVFFFAALVTSGGAVGMSLEASNV